MTDAFLVPSSANRRVRWANGLGWTREIVRVPETEDWDWRLSVAESDVPAAFSELPGVDRELILLRGAGLDLCFVDGETHSLRERHQSLRFAGERPLTGAPINGPTEQLNVMWQRDRITLETRQIASADEDFNRCLKHPGVDFIYLLEGDLTFRCGSSIYRLKPGDGLYLKGESSREPAELIEAPIRLLSVSARPVATG